MGMKLILALLAAASLALFWALKVGRDVGVTPLPLVEGDFGEAGW